MRGITQPNSLRSGRRGPRGNTLVEAALVMSLIFVPMLLGLTTVGLNLIRASQANQINRDAGHMFARGTDFSTGTGSFNRAILIKMAPPLATTTGGTAVLILSHIIYIAPNTCTSCPYTCSNCANVNHAAFERQNTLGTATLRASSFGTVAAGSMDTTTGIVTDPYGNTSVRADGVLTYLTFGVGTTDAKDVYVSETYYSSADLVKVGFPSPAGIYARSFF